jgi:hypothetical protein
MREADEGFSASFGAVPRAVVLSGAAAMKVSK